MRFLCIFILLFNFIFLLRLVLSFFPLREETLASSVRGWTVALTDPVVLPIQRRVPPLPGAMAGFGIAHLLVLVGLAILDVILCR